ncbi:ABC transporter ATP-binding protein [Lentibacillus halophilus]|uniref:ABC transporter ATP-binding protein n=1 Tax=Lentibacillus halophilus TaxID=295065 RepID=A0ABP3J148_9BACI
MSELAVDQVAVGYPEARVINNLSVTVPEKQITSIIGPNGCGKSTLLKAIARVLKTEKGSVYLDGHMIHQWKTKDVAKKMAILPQSSDAPPGLTVFELVSYGRFPHQKGLTGLKRSDYKFIDWAIEVTGLSDLKERPVDELSGGQRQRVWIAMSLAQDTDILILDEPTTYLDMAHQLEILRLLKNLNIEQERTIVMVLHDLNHASRFSHNMLAMKDGDLLVEGTPERVMTRENLFNVFDIDAQLMSCPFSKHPICLAYDLCGECKFKQEQ